MRAPSVWPPKKWGTFIVRGLSLTGGAVGVRIQSERVSGNPRNRHANAPSVAKDTGTIELDTRNGLIVRTIQ